MPKKILIIDDEVDMRALLEIRLKASGYEVIQASNGSEGLIKANEHKPNLIVLDMMMPVMDGHSFLNEKKKHNNLSQIPVLVLTAKPQLKELYAIAGMEELFKTEGIQTYMIKPFNPTTFLNKVKELLQ